MAVATFLEHYNFSGKKIIPFATHEGSGLAVISTKKNLSAAEVLQVSLFTAQTLKILKTLLKIGLKNLLKVFL
jgi:hypothetical protein